MPIWRRGWWRYPSPSLPPNCARGSAGFSARSNRSGRARPTRWRRADALLLAAVTDGLNRLFSNTIAPVRLARDVGLAIVNQLPPVKRLLMRHAMGTLGDRPRLARGQPL